MHLKKWYFDLITESGDAFLGYSAGLVYKDWCLGYSAVMQGAFEQAFDATYSMQAPKPDISSEKIVWSPPQKNTQFTWENANHYQTQPITLWEDENGRVEWHHLFPVAKAEVQQQENSYTGLGYAECLELSILPWKLPLKRLRWGRFTSETHALTWIEWQMKAHANKSWIFYNGVQTEVDVFERDQIVCPQGHLHIQTGSAIREGYLRDTALSSVSLLRSLFPQQILNIHEAKRIAPATFNLSNGEKISGWVIDEIVLFP